MKTQSKVIRRTEKTLDPLRMGHTPYSRLIACKEILAKTIGSSTDDNIALVAAGVAFYSFLAIVPLMAACVLTYGFFARPDTVVKNVETLSVIAPANVAQTIGDLLIGVVKSSGQKKGVGILVALGIALWGARNAAGSIMIALNIAYEEHEKRSFLKTTLVALAMTSGLVVLGILAVIAVGFIHYVQDVWQGGSGNAAGVGRILIYPFLGLGAASAAAIIYRYGPSRRPPEWSNLMPGALFSATGWVVTTVLFGLYATRFGNYSAAYGSLGGVVALLTWLYLSAYIFLFGAELNGELERRSSVANVIRTGGATEAATSPISPDNLPGGTLGSEPENRSRPIEKVAITGLVGYHFMRRAGPAASLLALAGMSLIRSKGKGKTGAAMIATAAGLAFLTRRQD